MLVRYLLLSTVALTLPPLSATPAAAQDRFAITPVAVVEVGDGSLCPNQTVLIEGDRITAAGDADEVEVPSDAAVIDGSGKYLIPGLWDMHTHSWDDAVLRENVLPLYVAHGITGIRVMDGKAYDLEQRAETARGHL